MPVRAVLSRRVSRRPGSGSAPSVFHAFLCLLAIAIPSILTGCGGGPASIQGTVASVTATPRLQPGSTAQLVFNPISGSFNGSINLAQTQITFTSATGATATATPTAQGTTSATQTTLTFTVPTLAITTATTYQISISGATTGGQSFSSSSPGAVTVYPPATIASLVPASSYPGKSLTVAITGLNTDFVQGSTQATFGAGIAVNGAASGLPGLITIAGTGAGATTATATLVLDPAATPGTRDVTITTGSQTSIQTATLKAGFTVLTPLLPLVANSGGPYTGFTGRPVQFNGSLSTDPNGQTLAYAWTFGDGTTATTAQPTHTYTKPGSFAVQLTVSDANGLTAVANTTATVTTLSNPVAVAGGPYTGAPNTPVAFDATASTDPNATALTYAWTFGDGGTASGPKPTHTYATTGSYTAILTVTDTYSLTATANAAVTITASAQPPKAQPGGPYTGLTGTAIPFNGTASTDPQNQALAYFWDFGDGATAIGPQPTHAYTTAGTYTARLTVTDTANLSATANAAVTVTSAPQPPIAKAGGPYTAAPNTAILFNGTASTDPQNQPLTYAWNFGDNTTGTGPQPTHTYTAIGTYTVRLTVTNTSGLSASATATATITTSAQPPTASAGGPYSGITGTPIAFNATASSDPQGQTLTYTWNFGDNTTGTGPQPTHAYTATGTYTATLTVTDTSNLTATATAAVTITSPTALNANPGGPYSGTTAQAVSFTGAASFDPKNETLTYAWDFGDGATATTVSPTHQYANPGTYTVTLTVTNTDAATATGTTTATIAGVLQAVQGGPYNGNVGQSLSFTALASTAPNADLLTYAWTFGDGANASGVQVTHTYATPGAFNVALTVTDTTTNATSTVTAKATITQPPTLTITSPAQGALFNTTSVTVTGTAPTTVQTVTINGATASLSGGSFTATVPVREGVNILTAAGTDASGNTGTASTSITVDLTPPLISVLEPIEGSTAITQQISISGMVTDQVTGTVNANDVTLTINGQPAQVSNRSFLLTGLILVPGLNTLNLVATDRAGNSATGTLHVNLANPSAQQHIVILSGDAQSGAIGTVLPQALAVQLVSPTGSPIPNRAVTFTVTASDGIVESLPLQAQTLSLMTDAQGKASVLFQLGSRAGLGINQVSVTSPGFMGNAVFNESATAGAPTYIHEFMGNNQRGIIGQPLAQAFQVIVQDAGSNPIAGVPVTFTVNSGDATFNGQTTITTTTNADGRATAALTLGQQEGVNNNTVTADFANDPNAAVNFYASAFSQGAAANTSVSGVVLDDSGNPVPNATARLLNTLLSTTTDVNGHFTIPGAPVGTVTLLVDGSTTTLSETLPSLSFLLQDLPGQNNTINMPVYLPIIDTQSARTAGGSAPATLSLASMPGVALTIAPNSVTFPDGSHVGQITLSQVKNDLVPMPPPNGAPPLFAWTIQPAGTKFSTPVTVTIPNTGGLPPGAVQEGYQYDHDLEQFVSIGTLRVSPDGSVLNSDPGFGITKAGWAGFPPFPGPTSCGQSCDDNNPCTKDDGNGQACTCTHTPTHDGDMCNTKKTAGKNNCQNPGTCKGGVCSNKPKTSGSCDDGLFCTTGDMCDSGGTCRGTPTPDQSGPFSGASIQTNLNQEQLFIQSLLRMFFGAAGNKFTLTFSETGMTVNKCCENLKKTVKDSYSVLNATGGISTPDFFLNFPPWSVQFPGATGGYGLYANFGISVQGALRFDDTICAQMKCLNGTVTPQGTVNIGLGVSVKDPVNGSNLLAIGVKGSTGLNLTIGPSADCHGVMASIGINALTVTEYLSYEGGPQISSIVFTPVPAYTFPGGMGNFQLP